MIAFKWNKKAEDAAIALANGETREQAAINAGVGVATIYRWLQEPQFFEEVDRLTFLTGIAHKAERLRLAKRVVAQIGIKTDRDLLDWLKYMQGETDGHKLDLAGLISAIAANGDEMAAGGSGRIDKAAQAASDTD